MSPASSEKGNSSGKRLHKKAIAQMIAWMIQNNANPYPSNSDKDQLASSTGLTSLQVGTWMTNMRKRHVIPIINGIRQPKNRLDHLFAVLREQQCRGSKLSEIALSVTNGNFFRTTRHRMRRDDFLRLFKNNFCRKSHKQDLDQTDALGCIISEPKRRLERAISLPVLLSASDSSTEVSPMSLASKSYNEGLVDEVCEPTTEASIDFWEDYTNENRELFSSFDYLDTSCKSSETCIDQSKISDKLGYRTELSPLVFDFLFD